MADRLNGSVGTDALPYRELLDGDPDRGVVLYDPALQLAYANPWARNHLQAPDGSILAGLRGAVGSFRERLERSGVAVPPGEILLPVEGARPMRATVTPLVHSGARWFVIRVAPGGCFADLNVHRLQARFLLTPREAQVAADVSKGMANAEIATHLGITEKTVKNALMTVFVKCDVRNRVELALKAHDAPIG